MGKVKEQYDTWYDEAMAENLRRASAEAIKRIRARLLTDNFQSECPHAWANYVGFTESFEYCEYCGDKKDV